MKMAALPGRRRTVALSPNKPLVKSAVEVGSRVKTGQSPARGAGLRAGRPRPGAGTDLHGNGAGQFRATAWRKPKHRLDPRCGWESLWHHSQGRRDGPACEFLARPPVAAICPAAPRANAAQAVAGLIEWDWIFFHGVLGLPCRLHPWKFRIAWTIRQPEGRWQRYGATWKATLVASMPLSVVTRTVPLVAVISNIDDSLFAETRKNLGVEFEVVVTAEQAGSYKPSINNFQMAQHRLAIAPDRLLHVGQSVYHDVVPARALGIATVWVNRKSARPGIGAGSGQFGTSPRATAGSGSSRPGFSGSSNSHDLTGRELSRCGNGMGRIFCWMATVSAPLSFIVDIEFAHQVEFMRFHGLGAESQNRCRLLRGVYPSA